MIGPADTFGISSNSGCPAGTESHGDHPTYIVNNNAQTNGDHEVHNAASALGCLPSAAHRVLLGNCDSCRDAVNVATSLGYSRANGCYHCAYPCHTS